MPRTIPFASPLRARTLSAIVLGLVLTSCIDQADDLITSPATISESAAVEAPGLQDFGPAIRAADRHTAALMKNPAIVGTAVALNDDGKPSVRLFLAHGQVRGLPDHLDGVPVSTAVTGRFELRSDPTTRARPAPVGFSIGHPDITAGTLGARVTDGTNVFILSNNHILANNNNASIGDAALQPGPYDGGSEPGDIIGTLHDYEPFDFENDNEIDAAIAIVDPNDVSGATPSDAGYGAPSTNVVNASVGMNVQKYGRTTGHTFGTVEETNVTVSVCMETRGPFQCAKAATFVGQFTIVDGSFSDGGDSGSLIVTANGNDPVGLLFAGSASRTIANPIQKVLDRFGVTIDPTVPDGSGGGDDGGDPGDGDDGGDPGDGDDGEAAPISLTADGYKVQGRQKVDLSWSGATSTNVDIFRDGNLIATVDNSGAYHDPIDARGGGSYTYQVCEAGSTTCSDSVTVNF